MRRSRYDKGNRVPVHQWRSCCQHAIANRSDRAMKSHFNFTSSIALYYRFEGFYIVLLLHIAEMEWRNTEICKSYEWNELNLLVNYSLFVRSLNNDLWTAFPASSFNFLTSLNPFSEWNFISVAFSIVTLTMPAVRHFRNVMYCVGSNWALFHRTTEEINSNSTIYIYIMGRWPRIAQRVDKFALQYT